MHHRHNCCCCDPDDLLDLLRRDVIVMHAELKDVARDITEMKEELKAMADQSALLNAVAEGLRALGATVSALLAENAALRGEDVAESAAATSVKAEYDNLAGLFTEEPTVPDVPPLPEPEPPVEEPVTE